MKGKDINSLEHTRWRCQYHIVFAPKYRRMEIYGQIKQDIGLTQASGLAGGFDSKVISSQKGRSLSGILLSINDRRVLMSAIRKKRKAFITQEDCVACGCCVKTCPVGAIQIMRGIMAQVNMNKCLGCGKCAKECPASVIQIREVEA